MTRYIAIESCADCTHVNKNRDYTEDSFETCFRYDCKHPSVGKWNRDDYGKSIARYVDWYEKMPDFPTWCPLKKRV